MPSIHFFAEDIAFNLKTKNIYKSWIKEIVSKENHQLAELNFIFCSDPYLLNINKEYLSHNYFTDIITFDNSTQRAEILGDIFISIDTVRSNAILFKNTFDQELSRVMIHGVFHLLGYADKSEKNKKEMKSKENWALSLLELKF